MVLNKTLEVRPNKQVAGDVKGERRSFIIDKFVEFCRRTDLHGYKYIVMEELSTFERCCWALAVFASIMISGLFVVTAYKWYARNPIVTVIESTHGAIWNVPFPAVTFCSLNMVSKKAARSVANNLTLPRNVTADMVFESLRLIPLLDVIYLSENYNKELIQILQNVLEFNNIPIESLIKMVSPAATCDNLLDRCMWKNTIYRCDLIFKPVMTSFGLCWTFNYFGFIEKNKSNKRESPRRVASCGYRTALTVLLSTDTDDYYSSLTASQGIVVAIDNAYNVPNSESPIRLVNPSTEVLIALSPESTYTTPGIKSFTPEQRQCYFKDEVKLRNFRHYSYHNCMAHQFAELVAIQCQCVPFYYSSKDDLRTCNFNDLNCLQVLYLSENKNAAKMEMNCLPECDHYEYPIEVAVGTIAKNAELSGLTFFNDVNLENKSLANVFFNDLVSTRYRRDVYLNWQNILASFGGLLSLMLGFTLVSGFDLVMFFTLRLAYDIVKLRKTKIKPKETSKDEQKKIQYLYGKNYYFEKSQTSAWSDFAQHFKK